MPGNLSAFTSLGVFGYPIPERSEATPGLFNQIFSGLSANLDRLNSDVSNIVGSSVGTTESILGFSSNTLRAESGNTISVVAGTTLIARSVQSGNALYDVTAFGAVGNNVADDTAAFVSVHSAVPSGGEIYIPAPTVAYKLSNTWAITKSVRIRGGGRGANSEMRWTSMSSLSDGISITGSAVAVDGLYINGNNAGGRFGLVVNDSTNQIAVSCELSRLQVSSWSSHGCWMAAPTYCAVRDCLFNLNGGHGFISSSTTQAGNVVGGTVLVVQDVWHRGNSIYGAYYDQNVGLVLNGVGFEQNIFGPFYMNNVRGAACQGLEFEKNTGEAAIFLARGVTLDGIHCVSNASIAAGNAIVSVQSSQDVWITNLRCSEVVSNRTTIKFDANCQRCAVIGLPLGSGDSTPVGSLTSDVLLIGAGQFQPQSWNGAATPPYSYASETSLGWYRSAASTIAQSYGTTVTSLLSVTNDPSGIAIRFPQGNALRTSVSGNVYWDVDYLNVRSATGATNTTGCVAPNSGTAVQPTYTFNSEVSLGLFRSANSILKLSYGTLDITAGIASVSSLWVKSGTNNSCGTAVLGSNGSVNVANTYVKTGDLIFLTDQTPGGTLGDLEVGGIRNSSGFTIQSTSVTDTSTVGWLIVRPT